MRRKTHETGFVHARRKTLIAFGALALMVLAGMLGPISTATAQEAWLERAKVVKTLAGKYDEAPAEIGLASDGSVIEVFKRLDGATWTIVVTLPNGFSRVVASGEAWMAVPKKITGPTS